MTTAQIVIYIVLFILDFSLSIDYINNRKDKNGYTQKYVFFGRMFVLSLLWMIVVTLTFNLNKLQSTNPCPQLEKVENLYKIK